MCEKLKIKKKLWKYLPFITLALGDKSGDHMLRIEFSIFSNENIKKVALSATTTRHWERLTSN